MMTTTDKKTSRLSAFYGVPVIVQLRFPLVCAKVEVRGKLPYADDPNKIQWIPEAAIVNGGVEGMQYLQYAVLHPVEGSETMIELTWASSPANSRPGEIMPIVATIATLIDAKDIVSVTRVIAVPEPSSSLILKA